MRLNYLFLGLIIAFVCTGFAAMHGGTAGLSVARPLQPTLDGKVLAVTGGCFVQDDDIDCPDADSFTCHDIYHCQGPEDTCDEIWSAQRVPSTPPSIPQVAFGPGFLTKHGFNRLLAVVTCGNTIPCLGSCIMEPNDGTREPAWYCPTNYNNQVPDNHIGYQVDPDDPALCDVSEDFVKVNTQDKTHPDLFASVNGVGLRLFE